MTFGFPIFLWFLPLAGSPLLFHLMMKRKEKHLDFSSLIFFIQADPKMHARRRLRELLLLAIRALLLAVIILALSRPSFENLPGLGGDLALAIVVDNSASMDAPANQEYSKLEIAQNAARRLLDAMDETSRALVLPLVPDPALDLPLTLTGDRDRLKDRVDRIRRTEAEASPAELFARIGRAFFNGGDDAGGHAVHVLTDLHESTWNHPPDESNVLGERTDVIFHHIPTPQRSGANVSIESISSPDRMLLPGHTYDINVVLRNSSGTAAAVSVNHEDSQGDTGRRLLSLEAGMSESVQFAFTPEEPGSHWMMVWIEGDDFRGDNRAGIGLICSSHAEVRFAGERKQYGLLPAAISPTGTGRFTSLRPLYYDPDQLMDDVEELPAMIAITWQHLSGLPESLSERLADYVQNGGRLFVLPDVEAHTGSPPEPPDWLGASPKGYLSPHDWAVARTFGEDSDIWSGLRNAEGHISVRYFHMGRYSELDLSGFYKPLAGLNRQRPVLAERHMGKGKIVVSGVALDRDWTGLATDPSGAIVVMIQNIATRGTAIMDGPENISVVAGERIPVAVAGHPVEVTSLAGDAVNVTSSPPAALLLARAGVYHIRTAEKTYNVSVRGSAREASQVYLDNEKVPFMGGIPHQVAALGPDRDFARQLRGHFVKLSLFLPLALLAVVLWGCEAWLATAHKKNSRTVTSVKDA